MCGAVLSEMRRESEPPEAWELSALLWGGGSRGGRSAALSLSAVWPHLERDTGWNDALSQSGGGTLRRTERRAFRRADGGARPPPATEIEEGCIRRACKVLSKRIAFLCGLFGQQMPLLAGGSIGCFWRAMRELGSTQEMLLRLAGDFKTSLLGSSTAACGRFGIGRAPSSERKGRGKPAPQNALLERGEAAA